MRVCIERDCVCLCVKEAVTFFSVCIPGNCSAALLNNETGAFKYVCACVGVGAKAMIQGSWK